MPTTTAQKIIIAASLAGIGGGVWYFFIRKEPDAKKISGGAKTPPAGGGAKTTPAGGGAITPPSGGGATTTPSVSAPEPQLNLDPATWNLFGDGKVKDDLMNAVKYVCNWITKKEFTDWGEENTFFVQRVWSDRAYDKSPVAKADLELLDKLVKKAALEEAV